MNKKILLFSLISMFMLSMTFAVTNDAELYYSFDLSDQTGTTMRDVTGNGYNGTCTNMNSNCNSSTGILFNSSDFDMVNDYIDSNFQPTGLTAFSINVWVYPTDATAATEIIMGSTQAATNRIYLGLATSGRVQFSTINSGGVTVTKSTTNNAYTLNAWNMLTAVYDGSNIEVFVNNVSFGSLAQSGTFNIMHDFAVGAYNNNAVIANYFDGKIDELAFYDRDLSNAEIGELYNDGAGFNPYAIPVSPLVITTNLTNGEYFNSENISIEVNTSLQSDAMFYYLNNTNYIVEDGLVAYYNFDGDYLDASGNGNDGTNSGTTLNQADLTGTITGAEFVTNSEIDNYALRFSDTNVDKVTTNLDLRDYDTWTVSAWIYNNASQPASYKRYLGQEQLSTTPYFVILSGASGAEIGFNSRDGTCSVNQDFYYTTTTNTYHHVTSVYNVTHRLDYVDGILRNTETLSGICLTSTTNLELGRTTGTSGAYGLLDDVRVYERALTSQEISDIYTSNDLLNDVRQSNAHRFNFEEGSGTTTAGQPIIPLDVQQVEFDGSSSKITIADDDSLSPQVNGNMSGSLWINSRDVGTQQWILGKGGGSNWEYGLTLESSGRIKIIYWDSAGNTYMDRLTNTVLNSNEWYHIAWSLEKDTNLSMYVNGIYEASDTSFVGTLTNGNKPLMLGTRQETGDTIFNGSMDEIRIYNRALTTTEIETLYNESPYSKICDDCNSSYVNLYDLQETNYNISFLAIASQTIATLEQNFNIDMTNPVITNTLPTEINSYLLNISQYVSCSDSNLKTCNITFTPDSATVLVNQTSLYNFTYNGNQSYNIIAEDQAGNIVNESGVILVNPYAYFRFNNSGTLLTNYTFGGTFWANETAKFTLYNSVLNMSANNTIGFSKQGYITQTFTQEVLNTSRINTTYNVSEAEIQVTIRDKDTLSQITGTNFTLSFIGNTGFTTTTITGNKTITGLLTAGDYELIVSSTPYSTENNFFTFTNQELLSLTVYVANATTNGFVTIEATGSSGELAVGATVQALQWNGVNYIVVSEGTTDTSGKASLNVILNTKSYQFKLIENGNSITSPAETITTDENGKTIPLSLLTGGISYDAIIDNYLINSTETYNNLTNTSTIVMDWSSRDGTDMIACINVYTLLNDVERLNTGLSTCSNASSSGQMTKNFLINTSQFTNIKTELLLSGNYYTYESYRYSPTLSFQNALLTYGFYFFVMLILYLVSIWAGIQLFDNIYIALMLVIVSGFIGYNLVPSVITNLVATSFGLMGSLTIWAGYKKK